MRLLRPSHARWALGNGPKICGVLALTAGLLSWGYWHFYLRGGPRIIDATSYWLQAHALAAGDLSFDVPGPSGSFRGRFLVTAPGSERLTTLFPPGYPSLLALAVLLRIPQLLGPALAIAIACLTYAVALRYTGRRAVALAAVGLSVISAALRYHTADTMSHGWAAVLLLTIAWSVTDSRRRFQLLAGAAAGVLIATRPVTGLVGALLLAANVVERRSWRCWPFLLAGLLPGIALLLAHQHAATGDWLGSSHGRYYALADGPEGCFRYGFGEGVGCLHEHGQFVKDELRAGYGPWQALLGFWRRLHGHSLDIANFEPLALLVPLGAWALRRRPHSWLLSLPIAGLLLGYVPFYFDGSYPGGGSRFFAEALPFEHVLMAAAALRFRLLLPTLALSLLGFSLHAVHDHHLLREREGGRPMFERAWLERRGVSHGLVFVATDHGFNLGHRPSEDAQTGLLVARYRGDAHDRLLFEACGRPPSYRYDYDAVSGARRLRPYVPEAASPEPIYHFEAEFEWPPLEVQGGWVLPRYASDPCVSGGRYLELRAPGDGLGSRRGHQADLSADWPGGRPIEIELEVDVPESGGYRLACSWHQDHRRRATLSVKLAAVQWTGELRDAGCFSLEGPQLQLSSGRQRVRLGVIGDRVRLDRLTLRRVDRVSEPRTPAPGAAPKRSEDVDNPTVSGDR